MGLKATPRLGPHWEKFPHDLEHLWSWFLELNGARGTSGFAPNTVSYAEIDAWARLKGIEPSPGEVVVLRSLDQEWLSAYARSRRAESQGQ